MIHDGLWSTFTGQHMGESSDQVNDVLGLSRPDQDAWAARSERAAGAWASGRFAAEVVAVEVPARSGTTVVERDEGIRPETTSEALAALPPAFGPDGTITAGNASLSDGAAATVVMSAARAEALGVEPLAEILAHGMCADRFAYLHTVPAIALEKALKKAGKDIDDLGLVEINEAFASVALHATRMLGADETIVNVNGGSVALGHALGSTGARMLVALVHEMRRRQVDYGAVTLCGGGGQGDALLLGLLVTEARRACRWWAASRWPERAMHQRADNGWRRLAAAHIDYGIVVAYLAVLTPGRRCSGRGPAPGPHHDPGRPRLAQLLVITVLTVPVTLWSAWWEAAPAAPRRNGCSASGSADWTRRGVRVELGAHRRSRSRCRGRWPIPRCGTAWSGRARTRR